MEDQPNWQANLVDKVKAPAIGLIIYGALGIAGALADVAFSFYGATMSEQIFEQFSNRGEPIPEFGKWFGAGAGIAVSLVMAVVKLAIAGFIVYAGTRMTKLRDHGICIAGAVAALAPCIGACCLIGLPIGIWALVVLNRADVRAAFQPST